MATALLKPLRNNTEEAFQLFCVSHDAHDDMMGFEQLVAWVEAAAARRDVTPGSQAERLGSP